MRIFLLGKWLFCLMVISTVIGSLSAFLMMSLDAVTRLRFSHPWLIYGLPIMGAAMGAYYRYYGKEAKAANREILSQYHHQDREIPLSMVPSIFLSCSLTHLVGGSVGRAGSAVQIGAVIATSFQRFLGKDASINRILISCGMAAGFSAVFGTPLAAAVFAQQIVGNRIFSKQLLLSLFSALIADRVCSTWGADLIPYPSISYLSEVRNGPILAVKLVFLGIIAALASRFYVFSNSFLSQKLETWFPHEALRAAMGGALILVLFLALGSSDYLGLGILAEHSHSMTLPGLFHDSTQAPWNAWLWKSLFTSITLSSGFKGGEIAPLLFIGAALGNSMAWLMGAPIDLFAGVAMFSLFAAATKAHYAAIIMAVEIFGWSMAPPCALAIYVSYKMSGNISIYPKIPKNH